MLVEEGRGVVEVLLLQDPALALVERWSDPAADLVAQDVAEERGDAEARRWPRRGSGPGGRSPMSRGDEEADREEQGVAGQEREEQPALDHDDRRLTQKNSVRTGRAATWGPSSESRTAVGWSLAEGIRRHPDSHLSRPTLSAVKAEEPRAPYDPMPHGPEEVGVGPWQGPLPTGSSTTPSCSPRATAATSSTATATGRWRRSWPTSTPGATTSTSRSRTGSTTSTSARSSVRPTRSWPARCTSSAGSGGTGAGRW